MRNLLVGDPQTQWDRIVKEMHEGDSWAGPDGTGFHPVWDKKVEKKSGSGINLRVCRIVTIPM